MPLAGAIELGKQRKGSLFSPTPTRAQSQSWDCLLWQGTPCLKGLGVPETDEASVGFPLWSWGEDNPQPTFFYPRKWAGKPGGLRYLAHSSLALFTSFPFQLDPTTGCYLASIFLPLRILVVLVIVFYPNREQDYPGLHSKESNRIKGFWDHLIHPVTFWLYCTWPWCCRESFQKSLEKSHFLWVALVSHKCKIILMYCMLMPGVLQVPFNLILVTTLLGRYSLPPFYWWGD